MPVSTVSTVFTTFTSASSGRLSSIFLKDMYLMCLACLRLFRRFQCHVFYVLEIFLDIKVISKQNRSLLKTCWPIYRQCWPDHCNNVCFLGLFGKHVMRGLFCKHFLHHQVEVAHSIRLLNLEKRLMKLKLRYLQILLYWWDMWFKFWQKVTFLDKKHASVQKLIFIQKVNVGTLKRLPTSLVCAFLFLWVIRQSEQRNYWDASLHLDGRITDSWMKIPSLNWDVHSASENGGKQDSARRRTIVWREKDCEGREKEKEVLSWFCSPEYPAHCSLLTRVDAKLADNLSQTHQRLNPSSWPPFD